VHHLTIRVAWHDDNWAGTVCKAPARNAYCVALDRIREWRNDANEAAEAEVAGCSWSTLDAKALPPCKQENGAVMSPNKWTRVFRHPHQDIPDCAKTHGKLKETSLVISDFAAMAVPYSWMLLSNQGNLDDRLPEPLPLDEKPPIKTAWVFGRQRQEALLEQFFSRIQDDRSLVFFYTKEGHPLGDDIRRLIVGVGLVTGKGDLLRFNAAAGHSYPIWDRSIRHSIRPEKSEGFLLPYQAYLEPTGDPTEDQRRAALLKDIAVVPEEAHVGAFSYGSEHASNDVALSVLTQCLRAVKMIRSHGIAPGPWEQREEWINAQIARVWKERGAFPGFGAALEALGIKLGTSLFMDLLGEGILKPDGDPWNLVEDLFSGKVALPHDTYQPQLEAVRAVWTDVKADQNRLAFLKLLSRCDLSPAQAKRWFDEGKRTKATRVQLTEDALLGNPYRISEVDLGDAREGPITIAVIDRGLLPDPTVIARHPVPPPSCVKAENDERRLRAALVCVLRAAAESGDSLLTVEEAIERIEALTLDRPIQMPPGWLKASQGLLAGVVEVSTITVEAGQSVDVVQLTEITSIEETLRKVLGARAKRNEDRVAADWTALARQVIDTPKPRFDPQNDRHTEALKEQASALERLVSRRLTVLVGRAGTGKTTVMGALVACDHLRAQGILLLAPTGKASVRLAAAAGTEAMTVARFLYQHGRYDGERQRPLLNGDMQYSGARTVVIDECSMLTLDTLLAVLNTLSLTHVKRIILVGDPNQLPPIGVGRPFADIVGWLEGPVDPGDLDDQEREALEHLKGALARLTVEVRTTADEKPSDSLRLAARFTSEPPTADSDRVIDDLARGQGLNDLALYYWSTPEALRTLLAEQLSMCLGAADVDGFNRALGMVDGVIPFAQPDDVENFQILSPVRNHPYGVRELNRWMQGQFRSSKLELARRNPWLSLGDEELVVHDKVMQNTNERRGGYHRVTRENVEHLLAHGEIGMIAQHSGKWFNIVFAGRPGITFGYRSMDFRAGQGPLELAYALTIHKAQGSDFGTVFVVLPKQARNLTRELVYTALTRSKDRLVLFVEGDSLDFIETLSAPEQSETLGRNSTLFFPSVRRLENGNRTPWSKYLIHRTLKGHMVRSKSELVIANYLFQQSIPYRYEDQYKGELKGGRALPDFSFESAAGDRIIWEHLGMLSKPAYAEEWQRKREWYLKNGFIEGETLFTTQDQPNGGLDAETVKTTAQRIQDSL
jgi:hypothetical protein